MKKDRIINEKLNKLSMDLDEVKFCVNDLHHSMQCIYELTNQLEKEVSELNQSAIELTRSPIEKAVMSMKNTEVR